MVKIRLKRTGKKNDPHYRIVVMPARSKRDGAAIEYLGYYNPRKKELKLDKERAKYWLEVGAQPTPTVHDILAKNKLMEPQKYFKSETKEETKEKKKEEKENEKKEEKKDNSSKKEKSDSKKKKDSKKKTEKTKKDAKSDKKEDSKKKD